jgi:hypothetical protein
MHSFFSRSFAVEHLEKFTPLFRFYAMIFGLTPFGTGDPWPLFSSVGG